MVIRLKYDGPYGGHYETVVKSTEFLPDPVIRRRLFPQCMGILFDEDCSYEILKLEKEVVDRGA